MARIDDLLKNIEVIEGRILQMNTIKDNLLESDENIQNLEAAINYQNTRLDALTFEKDTINKLKGELKTELFLLKTKISKIKKEGLTLNSQLINLENTNPPNEIEIEAKGIVLYNKLFDLATANYQKEIIKRQLRKTDKTKEKREKLIQSYIETADEYKGKLMIVEECEPGEIPPKQADIYTSRYKAGYILWNKNKREHEIPSADTSSEMAAPATGRRRKRASARAGAGLSPPHLDTSKKINIQELKEKQKALIALRIALRNNREKLNEKLVTAKRTIVPTDVDKKNKYNLIIIPILKDIYQNQIKIEESNIKTNDIILKLDTSQNQQNNAIHKKHKAKNTITELNYNLMLLEQKQTREDEFLLALDYSFAQSQIMDLLEYLEGDETLGMIKRKIQIIFFATTTPARIDDTQGNIFNNILYTMKFVPDIKQNIIPENERDNPIFSAWTQLNILNEMLEFAGSFSEDQMVIIKSLQHKVNSEVIHHAREFANINHKNSELMNNYFDLIKESFTQEDNKEELFKNKCIDIFYDMTDTDNFESIVSHAKKDTTSYNEALKEAIITASSRKDAELNDADDSDKSFTQG